MKDQLQLEDAKNRLKQAGLYARLVKDLDNTIRGGAKVSTSSKGIQLTVDPFMIELEGQSWVASLDGPYHGGTIIHISAYLIEVVMAVEAFFSLNESRIVDYKDFAKTIYDLQNKGIFSMIDSSIETPALRAFCTEQVRVEDPWVFMVQHASLIDKSKGYRIYPYQNQWAIDSPNPNDTSMLKIVPDISKASEFLLDLCGRTKQRQIPTK